MSFISQGAGTYTIDIDASGLSNTIQDYSLDMKYALPRQVLRLKGYRVQMASTATALAARVLKVELPFLSENHLVDNVPNTIRFPLLLNDTVTSVFIGLNEPLYMAKDAPPVYNITVYDGSGAVSTSVDSLTMIFETSYGSF